MIVNSLYLLSSGTIKFYSGLLLNLGNSQSHSFNFHDIKYLKYVVGFAIDRSLID